MKQVIVHIGTHKTGTSSIQEAMADYDDGRTIYARFKPSNHSIAITTIFSDAPHDYHIWRSQGLSREQVDDLRAQYRAVLDAHLADATRDTLIISGEDISILQDSEKRAMCDYFSARGLDLRIVCFTRDPRSLTASAIQQHVKNGMAQLSPLSPDYRDRLGCFAEVLPPDALAVHDYEASLAQHGDIVRAFTHVCGVGAPPLSDTRHNESLSAAATKLLFRFNRLKIATSGTVDRVQARACFVDILSDLYPATGPATGIDPRATDALAVVAPDDLDFLEQRFGITYSPVPGPPDVTACSAYFNDLRDINLAPLRTWLTSKGVTLSPRVPINSLLIDVFYDCLYRNRLDDADVHVMRDLAIAIAGGHSPSIRDAIALMRLVQRARPDNPAITALLDRWQQETASAPPPLSLARTDFQE